MFFKKHDNNQPDDKALQTLCDLFDSYAAKYQKGTSRKEKFLVSKDGKLPESTAPAVQYDVRKLSVTQPIEFIQESFEKFHVIPLREIPHSHTTLLVGCGNCPLSDDGTMKIHENSARGLKYQKDHSHDFTATIDVCMSRNPTIVGSWGNSDMFKFFGDQKFLKLTYEGIIVHEGMDTSIQVLAPHGVVALDNRTPENIYTIEDYQKFCAEYKKASPEDRVDQQHQAVYNRYNFPNLFLTDHTVSDPLQHYLKSNQDDVIDEYTYEHIYLDQFLKDIVNLKEQRQRMLNGINEYAKGMQTLLGDTPQKQELSKKVEQIQKEFKPHVDHYEKIISSIQDDKKKYDIDFKKKFYEIHQECKLVDTHVTTLLRNMNTHIESCNKALEQPLDSKQTVSPSKKTLN